MAYKDAWVDATPLFPLQIHLQIMQVCSIFYQIQQENKSTLMQVKTIVPAMTHPFPES